MVHTNKITRLADKVNRNLNDKLVKYKTPVYKLNYVLPNIS